MIPPQASLFPPTCGPVFTTAGREMDSPKEQYTIVSNSCHAKYFTGAALNGPLRATSFAKDLFLVEIKAPEVVSGQGSIQLLTFLGSPCESVAMGTVMMNTCPFKVNINTAACRHGVLQCILSSLPFLKQQSSSVSSTSVVPLPSASYEWPGHWRFTFYSQ